MKNSDARSLARIGMTEQPQHLVPVSEGVELLKANVSKASDDAFPALVEQAGAAAQFAWEEFIFGKLRKPHTRSAYERAIRQFLKHCELRGKDLPGVSPRDVGDYLDGLDYEIFAIVVF